MCVCVCGEDLLVFLGDIYREVFLGFYFCCAPPPYEETQLTIPNQSCRAYLRFGFKMILQQRQGFQFLHHIQLPEPVALVDEQKMRQ